MNDDDIVTVVRKPTLRERADYAARLSLCTRKLTDGFCRGGRHDCDRCAALGRRVAGDVLQHVRPTIKRIFEERGDLMLCLEDFLALIDEAIAE